MEEVEGGMKVEYEYDTETHVIRPHSLNQNANQFENPTYVKEFVRKYAELPQLWNPQHEDYTNKRVRRAAYIELLQILRKSITNATIHSVPQKINSIRSNYRKELRKYLQSRAINSNGEEVFTYKPSWRFREMYKFLGTKLFKDESFQEYEVDTTINAEQNPTDVAEVTVQETEYIEDGHDNSQEGVKTFYYTDSPVIHEYTSSSRKKPNYKRKIDYCDENGYTNAEFEVIGKNVSLKLRRMNAEQRCHAELLINKVLINGLKNNLSDETDLTDLQVLDKQIFQDESDE